MEELDNVERDSGAQDVPKSKNESENSSKDDSRKDSSSDDSMEEYFAQIRKNQGT